MADPRYRLSASAIANDQFRRALDAARTLGQLKQARSAGRWMMEELARMLMEFGESRDWLPTMNLMVRLAFVRPLVVQFAVNEAERVVFLMAFAYCDR